MWRVKSRNGVWWPAVVVTSRIHDVRTSISLLDGSRCTLDEHGMQRARYATSALRGTFIAQSLLWLKAIPSRQSVIDIGYCLSVQVYSFAKFISGSEAFRRLSPREVIGFNGRYFFTKWRRSFFVALIWSAC